VTSAYSKMLSTQNQKRRVLPVDEVVEYPSSSSLAAFWSYVAAVIFMFVIIIHWKVGSISRNIRV